MLHLTEEEKNLIERMAKKIVEIHMTVPAIFFLESVKPLNFIGSQVLLFFAPILGLFANHKDIKNLSNILEQRESIEFIIRRIEAIENDKKK